MMRLRWLVLASLLVAFGGPPAIGDDKPKAGSGTAADKDTGGKMRGQLPQNWGKLGLSEEQKQKIYKIQNDFRNKVDALQKQLADLKDQERKELEKVLTAGQRDQLRQILAGKAPDDK